MGELNTEGVQWSSIIFFSIYHSLLFVGLPAYLYYFGWPSKGIVLSTLLLTSIIGISITAGYHRLFSHKSYKAPFIIQFLFLFFGNMAAQYSALEWSHDHRKHHAFSDTKRDPYTVKRGFFHAHMLWILRKAPKKDYSFLPDLLSNPLILIQKRYYYHIYILQNVFFTFIIGFLFNDYVGAIVFSYLLRSFIIHHTAFFINSLAHTAGRRPYKRNLTAADNYFLSFLTFGEGYHNYHHAFPSDYRNGVQWYSFDPTKWLIFSLSKVGLARDLRRSDYKSHLKDLKN